MDKPNLEITIEPEIIQNAYDQLINWQTDTIPRNCDDERRRDMFVNGARQVLRPLGLIQVDYANPHIPKPKSFNRYSVTLRQQLKGVCTLFALYKVQQMGCYEVNNGKISRSDDLAPDQSVLDLENMCRGAVDILNILGLGQINSQAKDLLPANR